MLKSQSREKIIVGYDAHAERVFVDRRASGETGFNPVFAAHKQNAPLKPESGVVQLHILVDWSSIEVFANEGRAVITDLIYPRSEITALELYAEGGDVALLKGDVWELGSVRSDAGYRQPRADRESSASTSCELPVAIESSRTSP